MTNLNKEGVSGGGVMKVDRKGRVQTPPDRREALLDEYEKSGMSGKRFAEHYGIKYQTFYSWRCHRRKRQSVAERDQGKKKTRSALKPTLTLAVAELPAPPAIAGPSAPLEVELPGAVRLSVASAAGARLAAELIRALGVGGGPASSC